MASSLIRVEKRYLFKDTTKDCLFELDPCYLPQVLQYIYTVSTTCPLSKWDENWDVPYHVP